MNDHMLYRIVRTWHLSEKPVFRNFRCAYCKTPLTKAWHHWLLTGGYVTAVRLCDICETKFEDTRMAIEKPVNDFDRSKFQNYSDEVQQHLRKAVSRWNVDTTPVFKGYSCDECGGDIEEAWHIWYLMDRNLVEVHFCKSCGELFNH